MSALQTRQQRDMSLALDHVRQVQGRPEADEYGRLCLKLPILVQTNGLCQALAFLEEKGRGDPNGAHRTLLRHVAEALDVPPDDLLDHVRNAPLMEYIHLTRRVMDAGLFHKRFSVSILGVQPGEDKEST